MLYKKIFINLVELTSISNIKRISFRNDINGLRAIAVLSVVLYHAGFDTFKGGWLGVDIFFVISGYLITNIIISELNQNQFYLKNFYLKRIKRIIPAILSTILFSIPLATWLLSPKAMLEFVESVMASIFFFSNLYFKNLDFYNSAPAELMPLLHTWSLAIEEQFYILFPPLLIFLFKFLKKYTFFFLTFLAFLSIYLNTLTQDIEKFYLLQFRIWELLIGSLVVFFRIIPDIKHLEKIGFGLMIWPIFYFDDLWINDIEPKLICLFGLSIFIIFNKDSTSISKILNIKLISILGLSSYSIYLLHQPVFAFYKIYENLTKTVSFVDVNGSQNFIALLLIFIVILLSQLQYRFVEIKVPKSKYFFKTMLSILIFLCLFIAFGIDSSGYKNRVNYDSPLIQEANKYQNIENLDLIINEEVCFGTLDRNINEICTLNKDDSLKHVYVLGDSHSRLLIPVLAKSSIENSITFLTGDSCIYLSNIVNNKCARSDKELLIDKVSAIENSVFIYSGSVHDKLYDPELNLIQNVPKTISKLAEKNFVIVIEQIPEFPVYIADRILNSGNKEVKEIKYLNNEWREMESYIETNKMYSNIESDNVFFIDSYDIFCNSIQVSYCVGAESPFIYIFDDNHPTLEGAELIVRRIAKVINEINLQK